MYIYIYIYMNAYPVNTLSSYNVGQRFILQLNAIEFDSLLEGRSLSSVKGTHFDCILWILFLLVPTKENGILLWFWYLTILIWCLTILFYELFLYSMEYWGPCLRISTSSPNTQLPPPSLKANSWLDIVQVLQKLNPNEFSLSGTNREPIRFKRYTTLWI